MFNFGKSFLTMPPDEQKQLIDKATPGLRMTAQGKGTTMTNQSAQSSQRPLQKQDAYHDLDRLNHIVEKENEAHNYFSKGLDRWKQGVTGKQPFNEAGALKTQFDDFENSILSDLPQGGKRHTALSETLPKIKGDFLKQGHQFAMDKLNERSRTVLDTGLQRLAQGARGAKDATAVQAHDDQAYDLINKYVLSEAKFDAKDADAMYDKYLGYAGVQKAKPEVKSVEESNGQAAPEKQALPVKHAAPAGTEKPASSAQQAREMEAKVADNNSSGKLAGADNDMHHTKSAGADKDIEKREWTPEDRVEFARGYVGSKAYSEDVELDQFKKGDPKCNKFVSDVLVKSGAVVPMTRGILGGDPPMAKDWANRKLNIEGYDIVDTPQAGDIVATRKHVGIVSGDGKTISASTEVNEVVENDWGFRPHQKGQVLFRRYVGKRPR